MKSLYRVVVFPELSVLTEMKKINLEYCKELKILEPTLNDPNIIVKTEFEYDDKKIDKVISVISKIVEKLSRFKLEINSIDSYPKREYHYKIEPSINLKKLHLELISELGVNCLIEPSAIEGRYFNFTIPIIFGDLHKDDFDKASIMLDSYHPDFKFEAESIALVKKVGKYWKRNNEFFLKIK